MISSSQYQQDPIDSAKSNRMNSQTLKLKLMKQQKSQIINLPSTFHKLKRNPTNLFNQDLYSDDHFKFEQINSIPKTNRKISIRRLRHIKEPGSLLFGDEVNFNLQKESGVVYPHYPGFICQMNMLPFWHYETLIEPKYVNQKGFYHVVVCKDGRLIKETIDDTFYFDQVFQTIYSPFLDFQCYIWMHILLKVLAKSKGGYNKITSMKPFDFIRTFSYPDWKILNPILQGIQQFIKQITPIHKGQIIAIATTKNDQNVRQYGLIPDSAGYLVTGHYMQFEALFIRVKALNGSKWNGLKSIQNSRQPYQEIHLEQNEFIMPIKEFTNIFYLIYLNTNKFLDKQKIFYTRYSLNLDARQSKGKMILFEVNHPSSTESTTERQPKDIHYTVNLNIFFPFVRAYDLSRQKIQYQNNESLKIPFCKLIFGRHQETTNLEGSFVQSMKQMMFQNEDENFLYGKSSMQYEWVEGTYFKGYDNSCTFLMKLKPGRYLLRFKIQTLRVQYRANINVVSQTQVRISDPKMEKNQQQQFLKEMLSSKARLQKRNIGYLNPIKKGSWYVCNNDFNSVGYGYLVVQTIKTSEYKVQLRIDPNALKCCGYKLKDKKYQNKFLITLKQGQGFTLVLKIQNGFEDSKSIPWPPEGIQITRIIND